MPISFWSLIIIFVGYIDFILCCIWSELYFEKKEIEQKLDFIMHSIFLIGLAIYSYIVQNNFIRFWGLMVLCFLWIRMRYEGDFKKHVYAILTWGIFTFVCGYIICMVYKPTIPQTFTSKYHYKGTLILITFSAKLLIFTIIRIYYRVKKLGDRPFKLKELFVHVVPLLTILNMYVMTVVAERVFINKHSAVIVLMINILLILSNLHTWRAFEQMLEEDREKIHFKYVQDKMKEQYSHYRELEIRQNENNKIIHDIKNHIRCVERLVEEKYFEEAQYYLNEVKKCMYTTINKIHTNNLILDVILNDQYTKALKYGVEMRVNVNGDCVNFMSEMDICTIYSNLIDNAMEACMKEKLIKSKDTPIITISTKELKGLKVIKIENTHHHIICEEAGDLKTSKKNTYRHGIGLSSVKSIVEKYGGDLYIDYSNTFFKVKIIF